MVGVEQCCACGEVVDTNNEHYRVVGELRNFVAVGPFIGSARLIMCDECDEKARQRGCVPPSGSLAVLF